MKKLFSFLFRSHPQSSGKSICSSNISSMVVDCYIDRKQKLEKNRPRSSSQKKSRSKEAYRMSTELMRRSKEAEEEEEEIMRRSKEAEEEEEEIMRRSKEAEEEEEIMRRSKEAEEEEEEEIMRRSKEAEEEEEEEEEEEIMRRSKEDEEEEEEISLENLELQLKNLELQMLKKDESINCLQSDFDESSGKLICARAELHKVLQEREQLSKYVEQCEEQNVLLKLELDALKLKIETLDEDILMKDGQITILKDSISKPRDRHIWGF